MKKLLLLMILLIAVSCTPPYEEFQNADYDHFIINTDTRQVIFNGKQFNNYQNLDFKIEFERGGRLLSIYTLYSNGKYVGHDYYFDKPIERILLEQNNRLEFYTHLHSMQIILIAKRN